jgi:hypothetical protein
MTAITVLVPEYEDDSIVRSARAPRTPVSAPAVLTLIDNGKPKARELLGYVASELEHLIPIDRVDIHTKPTAAAPIDADTAKQLAARSRLVVTGLGD